MAVDVSSPITLESESGVFFGCFPCISGKQQINSLVDAVDDAMEAFGQNKYYSERIFHVSVVSWQGDGDIKTMKLSDKDSDGEPNLCSVHVDRILIRSGHEVHEIRLKP